MARALSRLASFVQNPVSDINSPHACRRGSRAASSRSVRCREGTREEVSLHFSADSLLWTVSSASSGARERLSVRDAGRSGVSGHGISARFIRGRRLFPRSGRRSARSPAGGERPGCAPPGPRCCALSPPGVASRGGRAGTSLCCQLALPRPAATLSTMGQALGHLHNPFGAGPPHILGLFKMALFGFSYRFVRKLWRVVFCGMHLTVMISCRPCPAFLSSW